MARNVINYMTQSNKYGMSANAKPDENWCRACTQTIQTKRPAKRKLVSNSSDVSIRANICGPVQTETLGAKRYLLTMTTIPSQYLNAQLVRNRDEAEQHMYNYLALVNIICEKTVKRVRIDNSDEF